MLANSNHHLFLDIEIIFVLFPVVGVLYLYTEQFRLFVASSEVLQLLMKFTATL